MRPNPLARRRAASGAKPAPSRSLTRRRRRTVRRTAPAARTPDPWYRASPSGPPSSSCGAKRLNPAIASAAPRRRGLRPILSAMAPEATIATKPKPAPTASMATTLPFVPDRWLRSASSASERWCRRSHGVAFASCCTCVRNDTNISDSMLTASGPARCGAPESKGGSGRNTWSCRPVRPTQALGARLATGAPALPAHQYRAAPLAAANFGR